MEDYYSSDIDLKVLLELLKADDDPIVVHQHCYSLQCQLSRSEEKQLADFPLNGYITRLIEILGHTVVMDFQLETKNSIMLSFYFLMDIFPNTIGHMVKEGLITTLSTVIQENMAYTDMADQAAKLFIKISTEAPAEMLNSPAIQTLMQVYDFCDLHCQQKVITLCLNVSRHAHSEEQFNSHAMPILLWIYPKVVIERFGSDPKGSEKVATIVLNIISSLNNFYSPSKDFEKFSEKFEAIMASGLIEMATSCISDYCTTIKSQAQANQENSEDIQMQNSSMIETGAASQNNAEQSTTYSEQTISHLLQVLSLGCKFSHILITSVLHMGLLQILTGLLPEKDVQDVPSYVNDLLSFLNIALPQTAVDRQNMKKVIVFGPRQVYPPSDDPTSQYQQLIKAIETHEVQKRELYTGMNVEFFEFGASTLLPKLFRLYRENVGQLFRENCISIIDKVLAVLPDAVATDKIDPVQLAKLVNQILATGTAQQVLISLQITSRAFTSNAMKFVIPFQREGASQVIQNLAKEDFSLDKYDQETNQLDQQTQLMCAPSEQRFVGLLKGQFGSRQISEDETVGIITLEIEKIKGILTMAEGAIPAAKRDMLAFALKDKEMQLKMIKEHQELRKESALKELEEKKKAVDDLLLNKNTEEIKSSDTAQPQLQEPPKMSELIKEESCKIVNDFIKNEAFLKQVAETHGEELQLLTKFKELARDIMDESCSPVFDCSKTQSLIEKLTTIITNKGGVTTFEFVQSGILQALEIFLTKSPSMALIEREALRNSTKNEEMKHSEELILSAAQKQAKQQITQKEARCLIFRIKVAANLLCIEKLGKFPLKELIHQCHEVISNYESILFQETKDTRSNNLDASEAIRSLHRREMIKVVYDPDGSLMEQAQRKDLGLPADDDFTVEEKQAIEMAEPSLGSKAKSMALPFSHMQGSSQDLNDAEMIEEKSQVYQKRDRLFQILGQVQLDVQHAENLWMVEERLKKVDNLQKAKDYGHLHARDQLRDFIRPSEEAEEIAERFHRMADEEMQDLLDRLSNRLDEMLDEANSQEQFELLKPGFIMEYAEDISELALSQEYTLEDVKLFFEMVQIEVEEKIQEHEMGIAENEDAQPDILRPEHIKALMRVKIRAFGMMINDTRDKTLEFVGKRATTKKEDVAVDQLMQEEEKKDAVSDNKVASTEEKKDEKSGHAQTRIEFAEPPTISKQPSSGDPQILNNNQLHEVASEDIEMTDEQKTPIAKDQLSGEPNSESLIVLNEQSSSSVPQSSLSVKRSSRKNSSVAKEVPDQSLLDAIDLNDLLSKNNGADVELQFYFKGKQLAQNTCFFEVAQLAQKDKKKQVVKPQEMPKFDKNNPASLFKHLMASMHRGGPLGYEGEKITIYFRLLDRASSSQPSRKDSLVDYVNKRERTKSQAADLVSVNSLNHVVQRLIETEFSVFQKTVENEVKLVGDSEKKQLENALKILKVSHFITQNTYLLSETGLNFLLSRSESGQELDQLTSKSMDLNVPLATRDNLFHHKKLDANILKQIQDPLKLVSGGLTGLLKEIFASCSFLFHYETKLLYFKLVSFLGVDINRSLGYLRQYQKKRALGHQIFIPDQREERKGGSNTNELKQQEQVSREEIFSDSLRIMERIEKRKSLDISFKGEQGTGLGPTYEYFTLLARSIKDFKDGKMWRTGALDGSLFPSPVDVKSLSPQEVKEMTDLFRLAGTFTAKSIVDNKLIDLPISHLMWDLLLGKKLNLFDLREFNPAQFKLLCELQTVANRKREIEEMVCDQETKNRLKQGIRLSSGTTLDDLSFYFTMPSYDSIELVLDGKNTLLTLDNVQEYIDLVLHSTFYDCVNLQLSAFKKGFNSVLPLDSIRTFASKGGEIEMMVCGEMMDETSWKDLNQLKKAIKPDHGFTTESRCYNDFLRYIVEMEPSFRPKFIQWLTGSKRLPKGGFSGLENQVSINRVADSSLNNVAPDEKCPSVNTCHHYVKFPEYSSYEVLKHKFEQAITMGADVFALN